MSKRELTLYFDDIINAAEEIEEFTKGMNFEDFSQDKRTQKAVIRNLEIIGEASNNMDEWAFEVGKSEYDIPWRNIIDFRNKITHEYFGIMLDEVWYIIDSQLPVLDKDIRTLKSRYETERTG